MLVLSSEFMQLSCLCLLSPTANASDALVQSMACVAASYISQNERPSPNDVSQLSDSKTQDCALDLLAATLLLKEAAFCKKLSVSSAEHSFPSRFMYSLRVSLDSDVQREVLHRCLDLCFPSLTWDPHSSQLLMIALNGLEKAAKSVPIPPSTRLSISNSPRLGFRISLGSVPSAATIFPENHIEDTSMKIGDKESSLDLSTHIHTNGNNNIARSRRYMEVTDPPTTEIPLLSSALEPQSPYHIPVSSVSNYQPSWLTSKNETMDSPIDRSKLNSIKRLTLDKTNSNRRMSIDDKEKDDLDETHHHHLDTTPKHELTTDQMQSHQYKDQSILNHSLISHARTLVFHEASDDVIHHSNANISAHVRRATMPMSSMSESSSDQNSNHNSVKISSSQKAHHQFCNEHCENNIPTVSSNDSSDFECQTKSSHYLSNHNNTELEDSNHSLHLQKVVKQKRRNLVDMVTFSRKHAPIIPAAAPSSNMDHSMHNDIVYLSSAEIRPAASPSSELNVVLAGLDTHDWPEIFHTLTSVRRLSHHHQPLVASSGSLPAIVKGVLKHAENLRSAVAKNALLATADLFSGMRREMDHEVTNIVPSLIKVRANIPFMTTGILLLIL